MDDGFLIHQVKGGNRNAFRLLVVRYQRPLFRFLGGFGLGQAMAEDLAQESFLRAYRSLASFDASKSSFSSWLFTIAKHLALNEAARSHQRIPHAEISACEAEVAPDPSVPPANETLEKEESHVRLRFELQKLPELLRSAVVLAYMKELSMNDIATIEGCSTGTVKSRIFRGKQMLRAALAGTED
jgi:RNA polymerase sigma-70 factor (ECF subfamily)